MLRRGRSGRARHLAWSETRQETDAMAVIQTSDREEWEGQTSTQVRRQGLWGGTERKVEQSVEHSGKERILIGGGGSDGLYVRHVD